MTEYTEACMMKSHRGMKKCFSQYRHIYTYAELERLGDIGRGEEVCMLFNNLSMYDDALRSIRLLG